MTIYTALSLSLLTLSLVELLSKKSKTRTKEKENFIECSRSTLFLFHHSQSTCVLLAQSNKYRCVLINMAHAKVIIHIYSISYVSSHYSELPPSLFLSRTNPVMMKVACITEEYFKRKELPFINLSLQLIDSTSFARHQVRYF